MYRMTSEVYIGGKRVRPSEVQWRSSVLNVKESCTIIIPLKGHSRRVNDSKEQSRVESEFAVGDTVEVRLGYNGNTETRFSGFVSDIRVGVPMVIECEGWDYLLRRKYYTRSYKKITLKALLGDLFAGTGIEVSGYSADVEISNVTFTDAPYEKIFDWLRKELLLSVNFRGKVFYAGISHYGIPGSEKRLRIGYNVITEGELQRVPPPANKHIELRFKSKYGSVTSYKDEMHRYDSTRSYNVRNGMDDAFYKKLLKEIKIRELKVGFEGGLLIFLEPAIAKGDVIHLDDPEYGIRSGSYFVESVVGSFGPGGGRQKIMLRNYNPNLLK